MARELVKTISRGKRNLLINSDISINQRGVTVSGTGAAQYSSDRWTGWFPSAGTYTSPQINQSSLPAGFPGDPDTTLCHRLVTSTTDALGSHVMYQRIESIVLETMAGNTVSFGFWASVNNFQDCTVQLIQTPVGKDNWTGQTIVDQQTFSVTDNTGGWQYFKVEDITLGNRNGLECRITFSNPQNPGSGTDTYITEAMCNEGPVVEPWRLRGEDHNEELKLCQRYFEKSYRLDVPVGAVDVQGAFRFRGPNLTTTQFQHVGFNAPKRIENPQIVLYSTGTGAAGFMRDEQGSVDAAGGHSGLSRFRFSARTTGTIGGSNRLISFHWTADAEL